MDEQFIPRKERHKKHFLRNRKHNIEHEKIKFSTYLLSVLYYFVLFLTFNLVQFYLFQYFDNASRGFKSFDKVRLILSGVIYVFCIICIEDTYRNFKLSSTFIRVITPVVVFILSMISMYILIDLFF